MWTVEWVNPYSEKWHKRRFLGKDAAYHSYTYWKKTVDGYYGGVKVFLIEKVKGNILSIKSNEVRS
jgi:hypothetical protein